MKRGFTLAEVLITLLIIGVVAALTIPSVISNYQQQEFKTGLKKAVSVLNEAIQTNIAQEGETPYENADLFNYLQKHMSILKSNLSYHCYDEATKTALNIDNPFSTSCSGSTYSNMIFYTTDGMRFEMLNGNYDNIYKNLILHETGLRLSTLKRMHKDYNDSRLYSLQGATLGAECGSYGLANNSNNTTNPPCIIMVDVNGDRKPNPPIAYVNPKTHVTEVVFANGVIQQNVNIENANQPYMYSYPSPTDKKLSDVFTIMITDEKAVPFGVVAQRAMYSSK